MPYPKGQRREIEEHLDTRLPAKWSGKISSTGAAWTVHVGDALAVLKTFPALSFDCVITSPPYYWLRDYGVDGQIGHEETVSGYVNAWNASKPAISPKSHPIS